MRADWLLLLAWALLRVHGAPEWLVIGRHARGGGRVQEGARVWATGIDPYRTLQTKTPPIAIWASSRSSTWASVAADVATAISLEIFCQRFNCAGACAAEKPRFSKAVACIYVGLRTAASIAGADSSLNSELETALCLLLLSGHGSSRVLTLAAIFAAHLDIFDIILLVPVVFAAAASAQNLARSSVVALVWSLAWTTLLCFVSVQLVGSWSFLKAVVDQTIGHELRPTLSLYWNLFTQIFSHFEGFFAFCFLFHWFLATIVQSYFFWRDLNVLCWLFTGIQALFHPSPNFKAGLHFALISPLFVNGKEMRFTLAFFGTLGCAICLSPLALSFWTEHSLANGNFYYALTLIMAFVQVLLFNESLAVSARSCTSSNESLAVSE